jgi:phospholipase C
MHPSSTTGQIDGNSPSSSMTMGELLVWRVYEAVRTSPVAERTLLIITFDEAGGTYDHVPPPAAVPPDLGSIPPQDGFDFKRLGIRVPMIMISAHIAPNTVVNTPMDHNSFMGTLRRKWEVVAPGKFPPLTARVAASPDFTAVFTARAPRPVSDWPVIPKPVVTLPPHNPQAPMNGLQRACAAAVARLKADGHKGFV